jgi:tRNA nucleotidyltransferase (CCA-adding enzyme)
MNIKSRIRALPREILSVFELAGKLAENHGNKLYLVGGIIRDLLIRPKNIKHDFDLVIEGDAITLAKELAPGNFTLHHRFGTAKISLLGWTFDLTSARSESYSRPGALPKVYPGSLRDDLFRRDFTINTLAASLNPSDFGDFIDYHGGYDDIGKKLIRVLHHDSFVDDATRIFRAIRYEQRLDFNIENNTKKLLLNNIEYITSLSGDRIRHEIEAILREDKPEKALLRANELGILTQMSPDLKADKWLSIRFEVARNYFSPSRPSVEVYLALLLFRLDMKNIDQISTRLRLTKKQRVIIENSIALMDQEKKIIKSNIQPSNIVFMIESFDTEAIRVAIIVNESAAFRNNLENYLNSWRHIKPCLKGGDLKKLGVTVGPAIKEYLLKIRSAKLDGLISHRHEEEEMIKRWLTAK